MLCELSELAWDAVLFSETRACTAGSMLVGGHRLISRKGTSYRGVAILLHARLATHIVAKKEFGDRVLAVRVKTPDLKFTIISTYVPHLGHGHEALDDTYICSRKATDWAVKHSKAYIIGGDFNTTLSWGPRMKKLLIFLQTSICRSQTNSQTNL